MRARRWQVVVASVAVGCGTGVADGDQPAPAVAILDAAQRSLGVGPATGPLQLVSDATVVGPSGTFRTRIHSSSDGRVRMEQAHSGFLAGIGRSEGWRRVAGTAGVDSLGAAVSLVRGHELHMLALAPRTRLGGARYLGRESFAGDAALAVAMNLESGDSMVAYFTVRDTVPVGLRMAWLDPPVTVEWSEWSRVNGLRLFRRAVFRQGGEEFLYQYDSIRIGAVPDALFDGPAGG